jgi:hypothetical protein
MRVPTVVPFAANSSMPAAEKRLVLRILDLWRRAHQAEELPPAAALSASDIGDDMDHVYIIDVANAAGPRFTHVGEAFKTALWPAEDQALLADCPPESVLGLSSRNWREIVERRVPVTRGGIGRHEGGPVLYRSIMMPLVDQSGDVSVILGAANWRKVEEQDGHAIV